MGKSEARLPKWVGEMFFFLGEGMDFTVLDASRDPDGITRLTVSPYDGHSILQVRYGDASFEMGDGHRWIRGTVETMKNDPASGVFVCLCRFDGGRKDADTVYATVTCVNSPRVGFVQLVFSGERDVRAMALVMQEQLKLPSMPRIAGVNLTKVTRDSALE